MSLRFIDLPIVILIRPFSSHHWVIPCSWVVLLSNDSSSSAVNSSCSSTSSTTSTTSSLLQAHPCDRSPIYGHTRRTTHARMHMPHLDRLPRHHVSTKVAPIRQPDAEHPSLPCFLFFVRVLFYFLTFHFTNKCLQLGSLRLRPPPISPPPPPRRITASTNGHHVTP